MGSDLVFVVLSMDKGEIRKRVKARHHGEEQAVEMMEVKLKKFIQEFITHKLLLFSLSTSCVTLLVMMRRML